MVIKIILKSYKKKKEPFHMGHPSFMVIVECIWINPFNEQ